METQAGMSARVMGRICIAYSMLAAVTERPELVKDESVYRPFAMGKYACAGKRLVMMELCEVTAQQVDRFGFSFETAADEFLGCAVDAFTVTFKNPLILRFVTRAT